MTRKKVLIAAGGSGGHLFPAQQLSRDLGLDAEVMFAGHGICKNPFFQKGIPFQEIRAEPFKRGNYLRFIFGSVVGFFQSCFLLMKFSPDVVVGFGSYHTFPILLASTFLCKKIVLFEANCTLGKVNRFFSRVASKVAVQFPQNSYELVPLLPWGKREVVSRLEALAYFGLEEGLKTILIFGGSQGASFFNEIMPKVNFPPDVQLIHLTGKGAVSYPKHRSCVKEFEKRMDLAYAAADLVICRSGAGAVAELLHYKKKALLIPFPFSTENHQLQNALFLKRKLFNTSVLEQSHASPEAVLAEVMGVFQNSCCQSSLSQDLGQTTDLKTIVLSM